MHLKKKIIQTHHELVASEVVFWPLLEGEIRYWTVDYFQILVRFCNLHRHRLLPLRQLERGLHEEFVDVLKNWHQSEFFRNVLKPAQTKNNNMVKNVEKRNCSRIFSNEVEFWPDLKTLLETLVFIFENFEIFKGQDLWSKEQKMWVQDE